MIINLSLVLIFVFFVLMSGLFSGSETGTYQLSRLRLRLGVEQKKLPYLLLNKILSDSSYLLISLLLGNNLCHYLATSSITYLILRNKTNPDGVELIATMITTPTLFVFAELIPKNLFFYRADTIMPRVTFLVYSFDKLMKLTGITYIMKFLNYLTLGFRRQTAIKNNTALMTTGFETILHETSNEGILSATQSEMMRRLGHISHLTVGASMISFSKVVSVNVKSTKNDLMEICREHKYTRYLVYDGWHNNILGYINIYKCLGNKHDFTELYDMLKPIHKIPASTVVIDAIEMMQSRKDEIILITQKDKPMGIVTMKDLVEELLGELAEW